MSIESEDAHNEIYNTLNYKAGVDISFICCNFRGCVRYFFTSLLCKSKGDHL